MLNEIITNLKSLSGNALITELKKNQDNALLRDCLMYCYNPYLIYGIKEDSYKKCADNEDLIIRGEKDIPEFFNKLIALTKMNGLTHAQISDLKRFIQTYSIDLRHILTGILFKDLRLGLSAKTINKIWSDLIPEFSVQLAHKFEGKLFTGNKTLASRKFDGMRCLVTKIDNQIKAYSRSGKEFEHYYLIKSQMQNLDVDNYIYDGEVIYLNHDGSEDFTKAVSSGHTKEKSRNDDGMCFIIFDRIKKDEFFVGRKSSEKYSDTYEELKKIAVIESDRYPKTFYYPTAHKNIFIACQLEIWNEEQLNKLSVLAEQYRWEGLMFRDSGATYQFKRTKSILKKKKMDDAEFKVIGFEAGAGKYESTLGNLIIDFNGNQVGVGSGFSDNDRDIIWSKKADILKHGLFVKVAYFEISKDKSGKESLRFPVYKGFRAADKSELTLENI